MFVSLDMFPITETCYFYSFFLKSLSLGLYRLLRLLTNCEQVVKSWDDLPLCRKVVSELLPKFSETQDGSPRQ